MRLIDSISNFVRSNIFLTTTYLVIVIVEMKADLHVYFVTIYNVTHCFLCKFL
jgi:hypothetical protein